MQHMRHALYLTYSNQKARDLKAHHIPRPFDSVMTLSRLILEVFERHYFETIIDDLTGASIIYHLIREEGIGYFDYLGSGDESLFLIFDFICKCHRNDVPFERILTGEKLEAIRAIDQAYQAFKKRHFLVDMADVERRVVEMWDDALLEKYDNVYLDTFQVGGIDFVESKMQARLLEKFAAFPRIVYPEHMMEPALLIRPDRDIFDAIDEVKSALKIVRRLLESGEDAEEILIVASDIDEYAPLYKLFLDEYGLKGYSSAGTALSAFHRHEHPKVRQVRKQYELELATLKERYARLGLKMDQNIMERLKSSMKLADEPVGIEMTEPNQLVGLNRSYRHIIFIGTDIAHFPPQAADNFLYTYEESLKYFYINDYYEDSKTQYEELKRIAGNLYLITATYRDKRKLEPSIVIDRHIGQTIDIGEIRGLSDLALQRQTCQPDVHTRTYYESIVSEELSAFDGRGVKGVSADHLSASQINKYLACPLAYLFDYQLGLRAPRQIEEGFDVMQQGSLMHLCFEHFGRRVRESGEKDPDRETLCDLMYEISRQAYDHPKTKEARPNGENVHHRIFLSTLQAGLKDGREPGVLARFVDYYIDNAETLGYFQHTEFEKEFLLDADLKPYERSGEEDHGYFIRGFIDRLDDLPRRVNVIDYKSKKIGSTGKDKKTQKKIDELKDVQLALYMMYVRAQYPGKACYAALLSFKGERSAAHFGELDDEKYDEAYEKRLKAIISETKEAIENGEFGFDNSDEEVCGWCDYRRICHEGILRK